MSCFSMQWSTMKYPITECTFIINLSSKVEVCKRDDIIFVKAPILGNKVIIYDCLDNKADSITEAAILTRIRNGFIGKTLETFNLIYNNPIGKILLTDICSNSTIPIIIFHHDFYKKCAIKSNTTDESLKKLLPKDIYLGFPNQSDKLNSANKFILLSNYQRCFIRPNKDWRNCTIFFLMTDGKEMCTGFKGISARNSVLSTNSVWN